MALPHFIGGTCQLAIGRGRAHPRFDYTALGYGGGDRGSWRGATPRIRHLEWRPYVAGGLQYLPAALVGTTTRQLDASQMIWRFFQRFSASPA